jgi:hypothetical protein
MNPRRETVQRKCHDQAAYDKNRDEVHSYFSTRHSTDMGIGSENESSGVEPSLASGRDAAVASFIFAMPPAVCEIGKSDET